MTTETIGIEARDAVAATADVYERVRDVIPAVEWAAFAEDVVAIQGLKRAKDAIILAHNYQTPEIFHGVSDIVGDSLLLARQAQDVDASTIVLAGVPFMAETAKLLNPEKTVLVPDTSAGCSLADSITADDVLAMKAEHPGVPVVTYVNSSAAVKAVSDICCTSGNVEKIVRALGTDRVILIPDEFLARNIADRTGIEVITWPGRCEVHERFTPEDVRGIRRENPDVTVLAHPECPPDVVAEADLSGSTAQMSAFVDERRPTTVALITECSMSDNIAAAHPELTFIRPCNMCPHMKKSTLSGIRLALETGRPEVALDPGVAPAARRAIERMLELS